jgi:flagellar hook-associated protein 2
MTISLNTSTLLNGNGIDVSTLVSEMISQESGPLQVWQQQQTDLSTQAGLLLGINNNLTSLMTAVQALTDPLGSLAAMQASSSNSGVLTATAQSTAVAGTHNIVVSNLASTGTVYTEPVQDPNASILPNGSNSGDIQLQVGGANGTVHDIAISSGTNDTLNTLASYINHQKWGVTATVINDTNGARLAIYSQQSGASGALGIASNNTNLTFDDPVGGKNASLTIDGVPFSSPTNTVSNAISGVTLNLLGAAPEQEIQLTVGADASQAVQAINGFITAYNNIVNNINQQFTVNSASNSEGPLASDSSLRSLQSSLLTDVTYAVSGNSNFSNLASLGIGMNDDGTLTVDTSTLSAALQNNASAVLNFFQNSGGTGFANNFNADLTNLTDATQGILNLDIQQNKSEQQSLTDQINNFQDRLTAQQRQLTTQFSQVNAVLEAYPYLLAEVTNQLDSLPGAITNSSKS